MDEDLRALERRWRETGDPIDGSALERALYRAGRVGYVVYPNEHGFGPSQGGLRQAIQDDTSGLSALLHPRVVLPDVSLAYRMLRSDEVMVACLADPLLLKRRRWSGASFLVREDGKFEVRPYCPFLVNVEPTDDRFEWPLDEVERVLGPVGSPQRGVEGRDYWVCDRSDGRYSPNAQGRYKPVSKASAKSLPAWVALAGDDGKLLSDFADLQYSVMKREYYCIEGMGIWVSKTPGLRAVSFDYVQRDRDAVGGFIYDFARSLRVAPIQASPQGEPQTPA